MQRRHFELIARVLSKTNIQFHQRVVIIEEFAAALAETNPRFDVERFKKACAAN